MPKPKKYSKAYVLFHHWGDSAPRIMSVKGSKKGLNQVREDHFKARYVGTIAQTAGFTLFEDDGKFHIKYVIQTEDGEVVKETGDYYEIKEFEL